MFNLCVYVNKPGWLCGLVIPLGRTENAWIKTVVLGPWEMVMKFITVMRSKQICEGTVFFFFVSLTKPVGLKLSCNTYCSAACMGWQRPGFKAWFCLDLLFGLNVKWNHWILISDPWREFLIFFFFLVNLYIQNLTFLPSLNTETQGRSIP